MNQGSSDKILTAVVKCTLFINIIFSSCLLNSIYYDHYGGENDCNAQKEVAGRAD